MSEKYLATLEKLNSGRLDLLDAGFRVVSNQNLARPSKLSEKYAFLSLVEYWWGPFGSFESEEAKKIRYGSHETIIRHSEEVAENMNSPRTMRHAALFVQLILWLKEENPDLKIYILVIPSKESVLFEFAPESSRHALVPVVSAEAKLAAFLNKALSAHVGAVTYFQKDMIRVARHNTKIFKNNHDRHPTTAGYFVYARAADETLPK